VTRTRVLLVAALALVAAVALSLLAVDVLHRESSLESGDVRYSAGPSTKDVWHAAEVMPLGTARALLGVDDDLSYRHAVLLFQRARPRLSVSMLFDLSPARAEAEERLTRAVAEEHDPTRKSQLVNLLGTLAVAPGASDNPRSGSILDDGAAMFRTAIDLDPSNDDAKANLELVLRVRERQQPQQRGSGHRQPQKSLRAGLGRAGSGY
jgi:hypothetical protein